MAPDGRGATAAPERPGEAADMLLARYGHLPFDPPQSVPPGLAMVLARSVTRRYTAAPLKSCEVACRKTRA